MIPFVTIAVVMTAIALACVLRPLLRPAPMGETAMLDNLQVLREQARDLDVALRQGSLSTKAHAEAVEELHQRVKDETIQAARRAGPRESRFLAFALALLMPLVAAGLYYHAGSPAALVVATPDAPRGSGQHEITTADVSTLVQSLAERMRREPANADGWYMLARSYTAIGRYQDAVLAYERLLVLVSDDAAVLADYADVLATVQGGSLAGKPEALVAKALALEPKNVKALALAGNAAFQRGDFTAARQHWDRILLLVPVGSALHESTLNSLAQVQRRLGSDSAGVAMSQAAPVRASKLEGTVTLSPALAAKVAPGDAVFIFARAVEGPRAPLAVQRITAAQLPFAFSLDDSQAMAPDLKLSAFDRVVVTARVSRSGSAVPAKGDLEGRSAPLRNNTRNIEVQIDTHID